MQLLSKLVTAIISPLGTAMLLVAVSWCLSNLGWRRSARFFGVTGMAWLCLWATPVVSNRLVMWVESAHAPQALAAVPRAGAVVVLGGAVSPPDKVRPFVELHSAADRVWHAARLFHAGKTPLLVLSGGSDPLVADQSEAQAMQTLLQELGVPAKALLLEGASRSTQENAANSAALLRTRGVQRILLVTSALHMSRAIATFESVGLQVVPVPVDHAGPLPARNFESWIPAASALDDAGRAFKELLGRLFMWLMR